VPKPVFRSTVRGVGQVAASHSRSKASLRNEIEASTRRLDREVPVLYREFAPRDTGELHRGIESRTYRRGAGSNQTVGVEVTSSAGHSDITRRGHRRKRIYPKGTNVLKVHFAGRRFSSTIFRAWVRGHKPESDWAEDARPAVSRAVAVEASRLNRHVRTRFMR
jgi:hypothetical protein